MALRAERGQRNEGALNAINKEVIKGLQITIPNLADDQLINKLIDIYLQL